MRQRFAFACSLALGLVLSSTAQATLLVYDGFSGTTGVSVDGQAGGIGWSTASRTMGAGGNGSGCDGVACACPETPTDPKVTHGSAGPSWTSSSTISSHNLVRTTGLTYPGLAVSGNSVKLVNGAGRSFRTIDATSVATAPLLTTFSNGPSGASRGVFGKAGTTIWMSFLASMDCGGSACTTSKTANNGGIHLFDGIGALDTSAGSDGPKHPFEHLQLGDRNMSDTWILGRTMGGCAAGSGTWEPQTSAAKGIFFDSATHLFVVRMRFDVADPSTTPCSNGFMGSGTCKCPTGVSSCLDEIAAWIDPVLSGAPGSTPTVGSATAVLAPTVVADFYFDTIEMNGEGESVDLDEIRIGTTYADVVPPTITSGDAGVDVGVDTGVDTGADAIADTSVTDTGSDVGGEVASDTGSIETGPDAADSGTPDTSVDDAGSTPDANDAAEDAPSDTRTGDAIEDSATEAAAPPGEAVESGGCGCRAAGGESRGTPLFLMALALLLQRRRRSTPATQRVNTSGDSCFSSRE